jgi:hypothetical protein
MGQVKSRFSVFGDCVSVRARQVHSLHRTYHTHRNRFGRTRWDSMVTRLKWRLGLVRLEVVLLLMQDWCTVCVKRTIGSEIVLEAPMELLVDMSLVESCFDLF